MSKAPTWDQFRKMLDELSKTNQRLHEQFHPLYERVGEHKDRPSSEVEDWAVIEPAWLKLVEEMQAIITVHLQQSQRQCAVPQTLVQATTVARKTTDKRCVRKKG